MNNHNHASNRSGAQRPTQPKALAHDPTANARPSQRNAEMSKTMRLKKQLNHHSGLTPLDQHPTAAIGQYLTNAVASMQPLE